jgi:hypothetical protein
MVQLLIVMETKSPTLTASPPKLIHAILSGFNTVTTHLYLVLFPVALDLILWFAPHVRVNNLLQPFLNDLFNTFSSANQADMKDMLQVAQQVWQQSIEHYNLLGALRSFPVGVPSLLAASGPLKTPLGQALLFESPSLSGAVSTWLVISLVGVIVGSFYFNLMARIILPETGRQSAGQLGWQTLQSMILILLLMVLLLIISVPVLILLSILSIISASMAQVALILISLVLIWLLLPLVFSTHGIFTYGLSALRSALVSYQLVRFFLPGTGLFLLVSIFISQGTDTLWRVPPDNSWMILVGILGHAFISTSLIMASFVYYTGGMRWMQEAVKHTTLPGIKI